ncbi:MAG: type II toxin-antitoxin system HicA family toxin [Phycisphaerales bacterium]|jgi:predicted RNA binding protein YcfA (HicA-like mRNA interferase family)
MKLPRDISGHDLAKAIAIFGYVMDHQTGSHMRLTTRVPSEHHVTIPAHDPIKIGTPNSILRDIGEHVKLDRAALLERLFAK